MTGAASGIGVATARALATTGPAATLAVRDVDAARRLWDVSLELLLTARTTN
ncbi:MAG: hypothetical protein WKF73_00480 [Nocardioidaceae bacterium]